MDPRFRARDPFTQAQLIDVERLVQRKLPEEYLDFVRTYGGAFVGGYVDLEGGRAIDRFLSFPQIDRCMKLYDDLREENILTIADCILGNMFVLYFDNSVRYIDYYGMTHGKHGKANDTGIVDATFRGFLRRIVVCD